MELHRVSDETPTGTFLVVRQFDGIGRSVISAFDRGDAPLFACPAVGQRHALDHYSYGKS